VGNILHSLIFFLLLFPFFFGIGRLLRGQFPRSFQSGLAGYTAASCTGVAVAAIGAQWLYFANRSVELILVIGIAASAAGCAWYAFSLYAMRSGKVVREPSGAAGWIRLVLIVAGIALLISPRLTGGQQFAVFQWSHLDTSGYYIPAATYQLLPHREVRDLDPVALEQEGGFGRAQWQLAIRPAVRILYATVTTADPKRLLHNGYLFLCYFFSLALCAAVLLFDELAGRKSMLSPLLALAVVGGFWGQYIMDINTWSHISVIAILLLAVRMAIGEDRWAGPPWHPVAFPAILAGGAFYLYPEATAFHLPAFFALAFVHRLLRGRPAGLITFFAVIAATAILLAPCIQSTVGCLLRQVEYTRTQDAAWSRHFLVSLSGFVDDASGIIPGTIDGLTRILGLYYLIPDGSGSIVARVSIAVAVVLPFAALCYLLGRVLWDRAVANRCIGPFPGLALLLGIQLAQVLVLNLSGRSWAAGKGLSYAAPSMMILLLCPCVMVLPKIRGSAAAAGIIASGLLAVFHLGFAVARPIAARRPHGIHYAAPYPSVSEPMLKSGYDWSDFRFVEELRKEDLVAVNIDVSWIRYYVRIALQTQEIPYYVTTPVFSGVRETTELGRTVPPGTPTVEILLTPAPGGNRIEVTAQRL